MRFPLKSKIHNVARRIANRGYSLIHREKHKLLFVYTGKMGPFGTFGKELYEKEPIFRESIRRCNYVSSALCKLNLIDLILTDDKPEESGQPTLKQIICWTSIQLALTDLWKSKGITPDAVLGMSLGDIGALYAAEVISLEDAVATSYFMHKISGKLNDLGRVLFLKTSLQKAKELCSDLPFETFVTAEHSNKHTLFFCADEDLKALEEYLYKSQVEYKVTNFELAYHTPKLDKFKDELFHYFDQIDYKSSKLDFYSCVGQTFPAGSEFSADYWFEMIRNTCLFSSTVSSAVEDGYDILVDVGGPINYAEDIESNLKAYGANNKFFSTLKHGVGEQDSMNRTLDQLQRRNLRRDYIFPVETQGEILPAQILSENLNLDSSNFVRSYSYYYDELRKTGSVQFLPKHDFWIVLEYKDVVSAIKNTKLFASQGESEFVDDILIGVDPPIHTRARRVLAPYFSPHSIESLKANIEDCAEDTISMIRKRKRFDLVSDFTMPFTMKVMATFFGLSINEIDRLKLAVGSNNYDLESYVPPLGEYFVEHLETRKIGSADDMCSHLLQSKEKDKFSPNEIVGAMKLLLCAGITTTSMLISSAMAILLRSPELLRKLKGDLELIPPFIEEVLRLESPVQFEWRKVTEDTVLGGVKLPKDSDIGLCIGAANRDSNQFPEPTSIDLERTQTDHLAFGMGAHYCLGSNLSRLEAEIAIRGIITTLPNLRLSKPFEEFGNSLGFRVRAIDSLIVENQGVKKSVNK